MRSHMNSSLRLDGLLFTHDESLLSVMTEVLDNFAIQKEVYSQASSALHHHQRRLDTVIVDWDEPQSASRLVRCARNSPPNSTATIVAVVDKGSDTHALLVGANFMIHKPANVEHATRCMRAAYGTILQNQACRPGSGGYPCTGQDHWPGRDCRQNQRPKHWWNGIALQPAVLKTGKYQPSCRYQALRIRFM